MFLVATTQVAAPIDSDLASVSEPIAGIVLMFIAAFAPYMTYRFVSFVGFDLYQSMGAEQEAKGALNRPIPIPGRIGAGGGEPKKVLDADPSTPSSSGGGTTPKAGQPQGTSTSAGSSAAGEGAAGASGAEAGAGGSAGAGGGAGAATAAGPAAAGVVAAKEAATAGPKVGDALGSQAEAAADGAEQSTTNPASPPPPPSTPVPKSLTPPPPSALRPEQEG